MGDAIHKIARELEADGIKTARGGDKWSDSVIYGMLQNEKYIGDAMLQKTFISDIFTHQSKKNRGELPKYYVHDCHPAIIDRETFRRTQEEIARRGSKKKTSSKAKTELGKYSGKYALSELLICGECGSPYRRQTYMPKGEKYHVWRCLNRMENGRRICKNSPTFRETELHKAILSVMNEMYSQQRAKDVLLESITATLAAKEPELSLPAIEGKIHALEARQMELYKLAYASKGEEYDDEIGRINEEKLELLKLKADMEINQPTAANPNRRIESIEEILSYESGAITEYNDAMTRQLISSIKMLDKERILVRFKDGTETVGWIEKSME